HHFTTRFLLASTQPPESYTLSLHDALPIYIKLLLKASEEGAVEVSEKIRGSKRSLKRFIDQIDDYVTNVENKVIVMTHSNAKEYGQSVLNRILDRYPFKESYLTE